MHISTDTSWIRVGEDGGKKPTPKTAKMQNFICFLIYSFNQIFNRSIWIKTEDDWHGITIQQMTGGDDTAEPLIRYFYYMCTDNQKEIITSARASLYSPQESSLVHFFIIMSRTTLIYYNHVIVCPHIHALYIWHQGTGIRKYSQWSSVHPNLSHACNHCMTKIRTAVVSISCTVYCLVRSWGRTTDPVHNSLVTPDKASTRWLHIWWEKCQIERCFCSYRHKWKFSLVLFTRNF